MIRALLWKEAREQGVIVGALAVLGMAVLVGLGILNAGSKNTLDSRTALTDPGLLAVVMLTVTAGAVVGGTLFAAEKENGTDVFLSLMPVQRRGVWAGKMLAGGGLVLAVTLVLFAAAAAVGLLGRPEYLGLWAIGLPVLAVATFCWGSVGSVVTRSSLAAAGIGVVFMTLATLLLSPVLFVVFLLLINLLGAVGRFSLSNELSVGAAVLFTLLLLPALVSYRLYTAPDRDRHRRAVKGRAAGTPRPPRQPSAVARLTASARAALWMSVRQQRGFTLVFLGIGLVSGCSLLVPAVPFVAVWPAVGLVLALLIGVLGWYDEQASGAKRFWVERRLPAGHLWWAKVTVGALACLLVTAVTLAPVAVKAWVLRREWESRASFLLGDASFPTLTFVLLWPAYGFAFGHLVGMLFRKTVVAASVALMVAAVAATVWLPSLVGGGVWAWQVWCPLVPVFALARSIAWACAADRVGTPRALGRLTVGAAVLLAVVGAGLGFRVLEIPESSARNADDTFKKEVIPPFDTNLAGQEYRRAAAALHEGLYGRNALSDQLTKRLVTTPVEAARETDPIDRLPKRYAELLATSLDHGWQPSDVNDQLLATAFATRWDEAMEAAAKLPLGTIEDPRELTLNSPLRHLHALTGADAFLLARGLKAQHDGDPERFVADFALVLNLSRNLRNKSIQGCAAAGRRTERRAVQALPHWLARLHGRDDLLAKIDAIIAEHDSVFGNDVADIRLADQVVLRNTFAQSGEVLQRQWRYADLGEDARSRANAEIELVGVAWQMPWEKERHERLVALGNASGYRPADDDSPFTGLPMVGWLPHAQSAWFQSRYGLEAAEGTTLADRRAARVLVALRRHELKHGQPPEALSGLVPEFLPAVPLDPFDKLPLRYRVSTGETIQVETRTPPPTATVELTELGRDLAELAGGTVAAEADPRVVVPPAAAGSDARRPLSVPAGRPVVWSVGTDRVNGGGVTGTVRAANGDLIYVLPALPEPVR